MEKLAGAEAKGDVTAIVQLQAAIKFNGGGHLNHSIFWKVRENTRTHFVLCLFCFCRLVCISLLLLSLLLFRFFACGQDVYLFNHAVVLTLGYSTAAAPLLGNGQ